MNRTRWHALGVVAWLTAVWVLLWGTLSVANVLGGIVVAVGIRLLLPLPTVPTEGRLRPLVLLQLLGLIGRELVVSSAQVAWLSVRPGPPPHASIGAVPLTTQSDLVLTLVVNVLNIQPGTLVVDMDRDTRVLYVHVLDVHRRISNDDDARAHHGADLAELRASTTRLEALMSRAFSTPTGDRHSVPPRMEELT